MVSSKVTNDQQAESKFSSIPSAITSHVFQEERTHINPNDRVDSNVAMNLLSSGKTNNSFSSSRLFANNKNNIAKLHWWIATPQPIQLYNSVFNADNKPAAEVSELQFPTQSPALSTQSQKSHQKGQRQPNSTEFSKLADLRGARSKNDVHHHQLNEDKMSQDSDLLIEAATPWMGTLNANEDDEMTVIGYRKSRWRCVLCWICILCTAGLLRLILHWWRHWYLMATHRKCGLDEAEKVLVQEDYKGKHKVYYVKTIQNLDASQIRQDELKQVALKATKSSQKKHTNHVSSFNGATEENMHLSVHFSAAQFKYSKSLRLFTCKQVRYAWDNQTQAFHRINGLDVKVNSSYFHQQKGLTPQEQLSRRLVFGPNEITVPYKDVKTLLFLETLNPFYVFQIFSVILWFTYNYYYYAVVILLMSIFGITMSIIQMKKNQDALRATVQNTGFALVVGDKGNVVELPTQQLVPGDIIEIPKDGCTMQCDSVLLSGNCIVDESMLTGESVPVTKTPLPAKRDTIFDKKEHARHTLFCGTKVIQTRYIGSEKVLAIVINTGNITAKGALIRSVIYPPPVDYKFEQDSYKFIECLALIALIGFTYTLISKIMRNIDPVKIAVESLDLITIVVPPALPAAMTVGRLYAQRRLERKNIYCISPRSINVAGSIDCCCFDKTGTLTEEGMDMWGVVPKSATNQFQIPIKDIDRLPLDHFLFCMVTCHSITIMNGKRMGDPLDLKMFESTGWILEDPKDIPDSQKYGLIHPTIVRQPAKKVNDDDTAELTMNANNVLRQSSTDDLLAEVGLLSGETNNDHGIVREFPFTSSLQRMSVITRRLCDNNFSVYCKGSPEMLQQLCLPETLPNNYTEHLAIFAKQGYRIIALAYKPLNRKVNYTKVQRLTRECVEKELEFLGFVVLENRLKSDTAEVINSLTAASIRTIMVTGDNILTALSVARDCGIVSDAQSVVTVNARQITSDESNHDVIAADIGAGDGQPAEHYELYYTLELGANVDATKNVVNGAIGKRNKDTKKNNSYVYHNKQDYEYLNNDVTSLSSTSMALPNSSSLSSVKTCDTWTNNDVELGLGLACENNLQKEANTKMCALERNGQQIFVHGSWRSNYRFALVGKTWEIICKHFPTQLRYFITRGAIFARMSPEQKQSLIVELQSLDYYVAMCGDGANDCGALKVAHTGISLSETESSIASPFTSRNPTISSVPNVIKEGRAALVTSFGIFKYMASYSFVQFISVMILYSIDSNLTDKQYLFIDLGIISVFAFFFGKTEAFEGSLHKQVPLSSLISMTPLMSVVLHLLIDLLFQMTGWFHVHAQSWFEPFELKKDEHFGCFENYTIFSISCFQYIILAFVYSKGAPYRKAIWTNLPFCLAITINLCIVIYLVIYPAKWVQDFFQLVIPPVMSFRLIMLTYGVLNFVAHLIAEVIIVEYLVFRKCTVRREQDASSSKRKYMQIEYEMNFLTSWPQITELYETYEAQNEVATQPTYVELGAEQNVETAVPDNNALSSFFEVDNSQAASLDTKMKSCVKSSTAAAESSSQISKIANTRKVHNKDS